MADERLITMCKITEHTFGLSLQRRQIVNDLCAVYNDHLDGLTRVVTVSIKPSDKIAIVTFKFYQYAESSLFMHAPGGNMEGYVNVSPKAVGIPLFNWHTIYELVNFTAQVFC